MLLTRVKYLLNISWREKPQWNWQTVRALSTSFDKCITNILKVTPL